MANNPAPESVGIALGRIPSGASIATATHQGDSTAMLASWVQQVSFEPPMICLAVKKGRAIESIIDGSGKFVLNIVGEDNSAMFRKFSRSVAPGQDAFAGLEVQRREAGVVLEDCIAHLACKVTAKQEAGDHNLYLAEVTAGQAEGQAKPYMHLRNTGFSY